MEKQLILNQINEGCIIPISHALNSDGYFRKCINGKMTMYHRHVWEEVNGNIPEGYEVDHKCKNRACCNIEHLQILKRKEHLIKTNKERYRKRYNKARRFWRRNPSVTGTELGEIFGVTFSTGCRWIRQFKNTK